MRINFSLCTLVTLLVFVAAASLYWLFSPNHASTLHYQGETINITRNEFSIPFISAPSRKAMLYAYGWVLAEDRAFQMTFRKLVTEGRLAEFLGEAALPMDKFMRELNLGGWG
jgi:penicillin amidase